MHFTCLPVRRESGDRFDFCHAGGIADIVTRVKLYANRFRCSNPY